MAHDEQAHAPAPRQQRFTLYAADDRVYARNSDRKLVDLGTLRQDDGAWCYLLDGNKQSGSGFATPDAALRDMARNLRFLWLDGQFTAVADTRAAGDVRLDRAPQLEIVLDELKPGERLYDATV